MEGLGIPLWASLCFAGLCGAWVFSAVSPIREPFWRGLSSISVGFVSAIFGAPAIWHYWNIESWELRHCIAAGVGMIGNPLCRLVLSTEGMATIKAMVVRMFGLRSDDPPRGPRERVQRPDSDPPI